MLEILFFSNFGLAGPRLSAHFFPLTTKNHNDNQHAISTSFSNPKSNPLLQRDSSAAEKNGGILENGASFAVINSKVSDRNNAAAENGEEAHALVELGAVGGTAGSQADPCAAGDCEQAIENTSVAWVQYKRHLYKGDGSFGNDVKVLENGKFEFGTPDTDFRHGYPNWAEPETVETNAKVSLVNRNGEEIRATEGGWGTGLNTIVLGNKFSKERQMHFAHDGSSSWALGKVPYEIIINMQVTPEDKQFASFVSVFNTAYTDITDWKEGSSSNTARKYFQKEPTVKENPNSRIYVRNTFLDQLQTGITTPDGTYTFHK